MIDSRYEEKNFRLDLRVIDIDFFLVCSPPSKPPLRGAFFAYSFGDLCFYLHV